MSQDYGSATIAAANNKRNTLPFQEPIGATVNSAGGANIVTLANGTPGGGFNAVDATALFALGTIGHTDAGKVARYVAFDVPVTAGAAAVTVNGSYHVTLATGGTYTSPKAAAAGQFGWVHITA